MFPWKPGPTNVTSQMRIAPYLLKMKWDSHPLYYHPRKGWGYLVPIDIESYTEQYLHW